MATVKISTLPGAATLTGTEEVPAVQSAATVKTTAQAIADIAITAVVAGAPTGLNTLDELAAAINDDPAFSATVSTALGLKADIASPTFTGSPAAPTQTAGDNTTKLATTAFVKTAVEAAITGLSWKQAVRVATTGAGTLSTDFENGDTIDGVVLATGDRILIKDQSTASENGIYTVAASGAPTRATDADVGSELVNASVYVSEGTVNADTQWTCSTNAPITVGSTSLSFVQLTSGGGSTVATDTIWDAAGDLAVGSGANTASRLPIGTSLQQLRVNAGATALEWATISGSSGDTSTALSISAGVVNIDCSLGDYFTLALTANVTSITFSNLPGSGKGGSKIIRITQDTTPRTVAWPGSFKWTGGVTGSISAGSGAIDLLAISTVDNGAVWFATLANETAASATGTKTLFVFTPTTSQPPASNFATPDTRNSIALLDFDDTTSESAFWVGVVPEGTSLGSGINVIVHWLASTATSGGVAWGVSFEKMTSDLDTDSFDTEVIGSSTTNGTSGIETRTSITITTIDGIASGDMFRFKLSRKTANGADTMVGDAEVVAVEVRAV